MLRANRVSLKLFKTYLKFWSLEIFEFLSSFELKCFNDSESKLVGLPGRKFSGATVLSEPFVEKQNCSEVVFVTNYAADGLVDGPERFQVVPANRKGLVQVNKIVQVRQYFR